MPTDCWLSHAQNPTPDFALPHWQKKITREQLNELLDTYYKKFYLSPKFIWSELRRGISWVRLRKQAEMALAMLLPGAR